MMLTIHGLPSVANYQDVRTLLQRECNLNDFILDNLVSDKNGTKKVRIGVADEIEGAHVIKCLDGFRCGGKVLYVIPVGKSQGPQNVQPAFNPQGNFQGNDFPVPINQYGPPGQVGSGAGQWNTDQWAPNQPAVGGYDYPQQNVPFQQQSQQPQRPLNQRELMLQASRVPVQDSYQGRSGNSKQSLVPPPSRPALRNIETVDLPKDGSDRYQNYEPKPITIKKDNFMGPDQFQGSPQGSYSQGHGQSPSWMDQGPHHKQGFGKPSQSYADDKKAKAGILKNPHADRDKYNEKPHFTPQRRDSPGRRKSPGRNISPGGRLPSDQRIQRDGRMSDLPARNDRMGPNGPLDHSARNDRMGPNDRRMPTDTRLGPDDRRMPMNDDRMGPNDRRLGPNDRRMPVNDDRMGPNDRRIPINDDRMGPNDRRMPIADRMPVNDRKMPLNDNRMGPNDHRMMPKDDRMGLTVPNTGRRMSPPSRRVSPSGRRVSPSGRRLSPPGRRDGPMGRHISPPLRQISPGRRISPSGRRMSPHGRRMSPSGRRMSPSGRRLSPPGRRLSPPGRRMSPSGRRMSPPGRRMSPSGRRMSPSGRRMSPSGRRMSPPGRRMSPTDKRISPDRRLRSPGRRSPNRRMSPEPHARPMRYSPGRDKDRLKQIRPAYEPDSKAANQAMYSGGYRPTNEPPPYRAGAPVPVPERISPWQTRDKYAAKKDDDLRKDFSRIPEEKRISPRASRSPHRRDRSPVRDRYRRHSPSPRSPRRSWALEKRRSPDHDAPPPPAWPGQPQEFPRSNRPDKDEKGPVWEKPYNKIDDEFQRDSIRVRKDLIHAREPPRREPSPHRFKQEDRRDDRYREPKYERDDYHDRRFPEPDRRKLPDREEFIARSERAHEQFKKEESPKRQPPRLDQYRKKHEQIEEEFQDIYQRAVDFAKKTQELKKHEHMKDESRHGRDYFDRHEERPRSRHSDEYRKREPEWDTDPRKRMAPSNLAKREKAADEISRRIIQKYVHQVEPEVKNKVMDEIKNNIFNKIYDMYGDQDISYIECIIKFNTRDSSAEERIFHEAASKYSVQYRGMKRSMPAPSEVPAKMARRSPQPDVKLGSDAKPTGTIISDWTANPAGVVNSMAQQMYDVQQMYMNLVPTALPTYQPPPPVPPVGQVYQPSEVPLEDGTDGYHLYLCKDTFNLFLGAEVDELKEFLISSIFNTTAMNNWAPSFIFRGLQTPYRYELITQDSNSRDWLVNLDFSSFKFNVLVYTSEELWYERVAVWLPGHSQCRYIDPFTKLQLQNSKLQGIDIGKWKFVRSIVTAKGTRLYIDVPPSAARTLEAIKSLSYELQKVNVFSKAMAVDKVAFDAGLNEKSIADETIIQNAVRSSPMPTLKNELDFVKITIKGYKTLTVADARKIKDMLVFELFKYLRLGGQSSTDFIKFGLALPCYFGVVPANEESKKWLNQLNMGNLYRRPIVILGGEEQNVKRIPLKAYISGVRSHKNLTYVFERLKLSNKGVKGLHFNLWKPERMDWADNGAKALFMVDMESVEALASLKFSLDYLDEHCDNDVKSVTFKSEQGNERVFEMIEEYKAEQSDSYVVANMEIETSDTDDDIICLGEATDPEDNSGD